LVHLRVRLKRLKRNEIGLSPGFLYIHILLY
jgi:hypothetical protein